MPKSLFALRRLIRRISINHPQHNSIHQELYNSNAGYSGEKYIDSVLKNIHFPIPHSIFPNFRLCEKNIPSSQIDILVFTPAYALVIEVKNWSGSISFQQTGQTIQTKDSIVRSMDCPIVQAEYYKENLKDWFHLKGINHPVHRVVIFPYASTILLGAEGRGVHFAKELPQIIRNLNKLPLLMNSNEFNSLSKKLIDVNKSFKRNTLCQQYGILPSELTQGVYCSHCDIQLYKKNSRHYVCPSCSIVSENPVKETMIDWFTLFDSHVTNKDVRLLSGILDSYRVQYYMKLSGFPFTGRNKGRVYHVNEYEKLLFLSNNTK